MSDLRWLFIDFNAYFASAEQQDHPELRGQPIAVTHTPVDTGTLIAASYEARAQGVQTGMRVSEAIALCPALRVVQSHENRYVEYHHQLLAAIYTRLPVTAVLSIDEMICRLPVGIDEAAVRDLAQTIKAAIAKEVGLCFRCSIGIAPNRYLAKIASELQKPDGFSILRLSDLPDKLLPLQLRDFSGIGEAMEKRLTRQGVLTVADLCALPMKELRRIWGGIVGEHMYRWLRGEDTAVAPSKRQSIGHSHVLPPSERHRQAAYEVARSLLVRAAVRLRVEGFWTKKLWLYVQFGEKLWEARATIAETQSTPVFLKALDELWENFPAGQPTWVSISLHPLIPDSQNNPLLFKENPDDLPSEGSEKHQGRTPVRISFSRIPTLSEWQPALVHQAENANDNQINRDDVIQKAGHDEN